MNFAILLSLFCANALVALVGGATITTVREGSQLFTVPETTITKIILRNTGASGLLDIFAKLKDLGDMARGLAGKAGASDADGVDQAVQKAIGDLIALMDKLLQLLKNLADTLQGYKNKNQIPEATAMLKQIQETLRTVPSAETKPLADLVDKALAALAQDKGKTLFSEPSNQTVQAVIDYLRSIADQTPAKLADTIEGLIRKLKAAKASGQNDQAQNANNDVKAASAIIAKSPVAGNMNEIQSDTKTLDDLLKQEAAKGNPSITAPISKGIDQTIADLTKLRDALKAPSGGDDISDAEKKRRYAELQKGYQNVVNKMQEQPYSSRAVADAYNAFKDALDKSTPVLAEIRQLEPAVTQFSTLGQQAANAGRDRGDREPTRELIYAVKAVGDVIRRPMQKNGVPIPEIEMDTGIATLATLAVAAKQAKQDLKDGKMLVIMEDLNKIDEIVKALDGVNAEVQPIVDKIKPDVSAAAQRTRKAIDGGREAWGNIREAVTAAVDSIVRKLE